jgi:hypothetical protein
MAVKCVGYGHKCDEYDHGQGSDTGACDLLDQEYECGMHRRPLVEVEVAIIWQAH